MFLVLGSKELLAHSEEGERDRKERERERCNLGRLGEKAKTDPSEKITQTSDLLSQKKERESNRMWPLRQPIGN